MLTIGLTGGIGTGKSTVSGMLAELGAVILNADIVGHEAYLPHQNVWRNVVDAFGREILNERDEVERSKLGAIVFKDSGALKRLNGIVHPWMYHRMEHLLEELRAKRTAVVVLEAALLFEANWTPLVDEVWVTSAPADRVLERLQKRNGMTVQQIQERMNVQLSNQARARRADVVIDTNGTVDEVRVQVKKLWDERVKVNA